MAAHVVRALEFAAILAFGVGLGAECMVAAPHPLAGRRRLSLGYGHGTRPLPGMMRPRAVVRACASMTKGAVTCGSSRERGRLAEGAARRKADVRIAHGQSGEGSAGALPRTPRGLRPSNPPGATAPGPRSVGLGSTGGQQRGCDRRVGPLSSPTQNIWHPRPCLGGGRGGKAPRGVRGNAPALLSPDCPGGLRDRRVSGRVPGR